MATEANNKASEVKATVDDMANAFSHDEHGAHVGDKKAGHVTVKSDGMSIYNGEVPIASFESGIISLNNGSLNIVAGYQDNKGDRATALMTDNILLKPTGYLLSDSQAIAAKISNSDGMHFAELGLTDSTLMLSADNRAKEESINYTNLVKLLKFTPWTTLQDDGACHVRYCIRGGMMYLDCYLAAGYSARTTTAEMPDNLLPAIEGYYPMGTETGDHTAKIWIGAAGGSNKHIYLYNNSTGYATGIIPILPKSME